MGKSSKAVTTNTKMVKTGNMTLIDSPGTNDPDKRRQDRLIMSELFNTIRSLLTSREQGINAFCQCIMPDKSNRIRRSAI